MDDIINRVAKAILVRASQRGHYVSPAVVNYLAAAAIEAVPARMTDLTAYREVMIEAILEQHTDAAFNHWPTGSVDRKHVRAEAETYRPYAAKDVDAIIAALNRVNT